MGFAVTGLRGGVSSQKMPVAKRIWADILTDSNFGSIDRRTSRASPATLTAVVNNQCNLACRHCYLQADNLMDRELPLVEWEKIANSVSNASNTDAVVLAGKEVFLGTKGAEVLSLFSKAFREMPDSPRLGVISNGTLVHRHLDRLNSEALDYFDVSVDGHRDAHDAVRGKGAFEAMARNLPLLKEHFGDKLFASLTVQKANLNTLESSLSELGKLGFSTIGLGFYQPQSYTDQDLAIESLDYVRFFAVLKSLSHAHLCQPLQLLTELDMTNFRALLAFLRSGWFDPSSVFVDSRGDIVQETCFPNGLQMQFRLDFWPSLTTRSARLTTEGLYLAGDDTLNTRLYGLHSLGQIRDWNGDLLALHRSALGRSRLDQIWSDYLNKKLPLLRAALLESGVIDSSIAIEA